MTGAGGTPIQYWLLKPPDFDPAKKYPVVFLIHGGPQGAWDDAWSSRWNPSLWAAQGWVVAAPNPRGSTGFGQKFVDEISQRLGRQGDGRISTPCSTRSRSCRSSIAARMGIAGASYGGYAVNWIIGHTDRFKAAVTHDGVFNLESMALATEELWFTEWEFGGPPWDAKARAQFAKWSPHLFAHNIKTPTLIITNELDFRVPVDQGLQMFTVAAPQRRAERGARVPGRGALGAEGAQQPAWHEAVFGWMKKYLQKTNPGSGLGTRGLALGSTRLPPNPSPSPESRTPTYFRVTLTPPFDVLIPIGAPPEPSCTLTRGLSGSARRRGNRS